MPNKHRYRKEWKDERNANRTAGQYCDEAVLEPNAEELAGKSQMIPSLINAGVQELSVAPSPNCRSEGADSDVAMNRAMRAKVTQMRLTEPRSHVK